MRKITCRIFIQRCGEKFSLNVKAYTYDGEFCFHRDAFAKSHWRLTHIDTGLCDGRIYATREKALIAFCEPEWHEKCVKAGQRVVFDPTQFPLKKIIERGEIVDAISE